MVLQAVLKTISKLVVEEGKVEIQLVYWTPKDYQTGDWIAKKEPAFHDQE